MYVCKLCMCILTTNNEEFRPGCCLDSVDDSPQLAEESYQLVSSRQAMQSCH